MLSAVYILWFLVKPHLAPQLKLLSQAVLLTACATACKLWRVLALTKLTGLVRRFPKELDTPIGFRGWALSNSQRQRLAVARALLRDPQVLVLDDFTATLDSADELELVRDVLAESKRRTVICTTGFAAVAALFGRVVERRATQ